MTRLLNSLAVAILATSLCLENAGFAQASALPRLEADSLGGKHESESGHLRAAGEMAGMLLLRPRSPVAALTPAVAEADISPGASSSGRAGTAEPDRVASHAWTYARTANVCGGSRRPCSGT